MIDLTKPWPLGIDRRNWPVYVLLAIIVIGLLFLVDEGMSRTSVAWSDGLRAPFFVITDLGLAEWTLLPSTALLIAAGIGRLATSGLWQRASGELAAFGGFVLIGVTGPGLLALLLKRIIGRARPVLFEEEGLLAFRSIFNDWTFQSFPSGHSTTIMATAFVVGFIWPRAFIPVLLAALVIAFSRIPVGMHYPTDVFGGVLLGILGAYAARNAFASRGWLFSFTQEGHVVRKPLPALNEVRSRLAQRASR